ncbi:LysR family transcriptional regulator [Rhizobium sp. BK060]|uniref:LysR family transcriptional regulator n=1 Tax=Rhizobium sp. BK060 TaxID=2587096 RepID=UPI0017F4DE49|nr:LysR family transcriptional regulator [Rhizobium sp. BK060]MBB3398817.1 DNA-binding transcriptional LysR family regulator [Rhizobium sp. BK060]
MSTSIFQGSQIDELAALLAVAEQGSFIAASRVLQRHQTIVSKRIAALEHRLGVRLLERTTRKVRLTEAGKCLADRLRVAADAIAEAEQEALSGATELRGKLRLSLPAAMGRLWLASSLPDFMRRYPNLEVEVDYTERCVDLVGEGFDAAIRVGALADSRLIARKLGNHRIVLGASPGYCANHGYPGSPVDLARHNVLEYTGPVSSPELWLSNGHRRESFVPCGSFRSNDITALLEGAREGIGIVCAGEWLMARDFAVGSLVRILQSWDFEAGGGVYLVRPSVHYSVARTEAFATWISELFASGSPWESILPEDSR